MLRSNGRLMGVPLRPSREALAQGLNLYVSLSLNFFLSSFSVNHAVAVQEAQSRDDMHCFRTTESRYVALILIPRTGGGRVSIRITPGRCRG